MATEQPGCRCDKVSGRQLLAGYSEALGGEVRNQMSWAVSLGVAFFGCTDGGSKDSTASGDGGGGGLDSGPRARPPSAPLVSIVPASPMTGDDLSFQVNQSPVDPDGDALTWFVAWFVDGVPATGWTDTVPSDETRKHQVWEVRITVSDGTYTSETGLGVVVIGNTPPVAAAVLSPPAPTTLDRLSVSTSSVDPDEEDVVGYAIVWSVNGVDTGLTGLDVDPSLTTEGEVWSVTVTPVDPDDSGAPVSESVTIENSLPIVDSVEIVPDNPATLDDVEALFTGSDPDVADVLTPVFSWTVDGVEVGTEDTLSSSLFVRGQELGLSVSMHDGTVEGPARFTDPVIVDNTPPSLVGADLDPVSPDTFDEVLCIPRGWSDPDGDLEDYSFQWTLDGVPGPTVDHWHLSSSGASEGQVLSCTVTPSDGRDTGASVVVSATLSGG